MRKPTTPQTQRTLSQNNAIHLYLSWLADELQEQGQTMQNVVERIRRAEITPTTENLKEVVWKPMQKAIYQESSSTRLKKSEVSEVHKHLNAWTSKEFGINLPFPSDEEQMLNNQE